MSVGKLIKKRREELNLSQKEMAYILGVSTCTLGNWENDRHLPTNYWHVVALTCMGIDVKAKRMLNVQSWLETVLKTVGKERINYIMEGKLQGYGINNS